MVFTFILENKQKFQGICLPYPVRTVVGSQKTTSIKKGDEIKHEPANFCEHIGF